MAASPQIQANLEAGRDLHEIHQQAQSLPDYHLFRLPVFVDRSEHGTSCAYAQKTSALSETQREDLVVLVDGLYQACKNFLEKYGD